jgi:hypothetical protein
MGYALAIAPGPSGVGFTYFPPVFWHVLAASSDATSVAVAPRDVRQELVPGLADGEAGVAVDEVEEVAVAADRGVGVVAAV